MATVTTKQVHGVAAGFTSAFADGWVEEGNPGYCTLVHAEPAAPTTVFDLGVLGKDYILVGSDPTVTAMNQFQFTNGAHNNAPQPPGGTCCAASSDTSDAITQVPGDNPPSFQFETLNQSSTIGDRMLTFEYSIPGEGGTAVQLNVTARQFAYLANNNPSNTCTQAYGTDRMYIYTVFTHPDRTSLTPGIAAGAPVNENFSPALTSQTITGNGSLNANSQIVDHISSGCSSKPLTCTQTSTQTISITGYPVRTNTLQWTTSGVNYTNDGPTQ